VHLEFPLSTINADLSGQSEFGEDKRVGGGEVRGVRRVKINNLSVIQKLLRSWSDT